MIEDEMIPDKTAPIVVCPDCGATEWVAHDVSFTCSEAVGELRVQPLLGRGLWPDSWDWLDVADCETYAWECCGEFCGNIYADTDLLRWAMRIDTTSPEATSYKEAEIQWLHERLIRLGSVHH
jgi:hypothetical protein